jgi:hypothetical protein
MAGFGPLSHFAVSTGTSAMECMAVQIITDERGEPHKKVERTAQVATVSAVPAPWLRIQEVRKVM